MKGRRVWAGSPRRPEAKVCSGFAIAHLFRRKVAALGRSTRGDQGSRRKWLGELRVSSREFPARGVSRRGRIAKGFCVVLLRRYRQRACQARGHLQGFFIGPEKTGQAEVGWAPGALNGNTRRNGLAATPVRSWGQAIRGGGLIHARASPCRRGRRTRAILVPGEGRQTIRTIGGSRVASPC